MSIETPRQQATADDLPERSPAAAVGRLLLNLGLALLFPLMAVVLAFLIGALVILATGNNPYEAYVALILGGYGSTTALGRTIVNATPLIFTGLAVAVAFRAGLFNIGGEGQFFVGAMAGVWIGLTLPGPGPLVMVTGIVIAGIAGFVWGAIPGLLKIAGAHEVITTIMLNFVAINLVFWLAQNPLAGEGQVPGTDFVDPSARIPALGLGLGAAHWGFVLGLVAAIVAYLLIWRTTRGYEIRASGLSPRAAMYAGMSVAANGFLAIALGGMFAGLGGATASLGTFGKVSVPFVSNLGFVGIGVALLGRNHPAGVVVGALFFGGLAAGAQQMQFATDVPLDLADVLLAIVLLFVTATRLVEMLIGRRARALVAGTKLEQGLGA